MTSMPLKMKRYQEPFAAHGGPTQGQGIADKGYGADAGER